MCIRDPTGFDPSVASVDHRRWSARRARPSTCSHARSVGPKTSNSPPRLSVAGLAAINVQRNEEFLASWSTCKRAERSRPPWSCLPDTLLVAVRQPWAPPLAGLRRQLPAPLALQAVGPALYS